jgi:hypothetical protein
MAKTLTAGQQNALDATAVWPVLFIEIDWHSDDGGVQRYVTAGAKIPWNGYDWLATGNLVDVAPIVETSEIAAEGVKFTLAGGPQSLVSTALQGKVQGRRVTMWLGLLDAAGALIDTPVKEWEGLGDTLDIVDSPDKSTIVFKVESRMAALLGSVTRRYTDEDQRKFHPNDRIFKYVAQMEQRSIIFPSANAQR